MDVSFGIIGASSDLCIARRFMNFIFGCMHCNSTFISSVVRSAFSNMNSPIGMNVRLCALKYGIGEGQKYEVREMLDVGGSVRHFLFGVSLMVCHGKCLQGRILRVRLLLYMRACCGLVRISLHRRRKNCLLSLAYCTLLM